MSYTSFTVEVDKELESEIDSMLDFLGEEFALLVQRNIGIQGPPRSKEGEFPRMDTRELHNKMVWWVDDGTVYITSEAPHTAHVEKIRPFLVRTLEEEWNTLQRILKTYGRKNG